jgi:hypothetical protein
MGPLAAPRARWARPELGNHAMMTPDQHCDEWGGYFGIARHDVGVVRAHHRLSSAPSMGRIDGARAPLSAQ